MRALPGTVAQIVEDRLREEVPDIGPDFHGGVTSEATSKMPITDHSERLDTIRRSATQQRWAECYPARIRRQGSEQVVLRCPEPETYR